VVLPCFTHCFGAMDLRPSMTKLIKSMMLGNEAEA